MKNKSKQKKISAQQHPTKITEEGKQVQDDQNSEDSENSDSDNSGVDERGMERLMAALGDDGLDDVAKKMLTALDERTNETEGSQKSNESISEGEDGEGTEDGEDDYSDEVDSEEDEEDYVPKVKLRAEKDDEDEDDDEESDSESDNEKDKEKKIMKKKKAANLIPKESRNKVNVPQDHDNQVSGIPLDEVSDLDEDTIPQQKLTVNNKVTIVYLPVRLLTLFQHALDSILRSIELDQSLPWTETLITTYPQIHEVDVSNDLERELSFYKQALHSAEAAKKLAADHSLPFTRPSDFFAEMVKSDAHMERTRQRLLDETAQIKRGEEKRREREGKKFGKQVQIEKLKERERSKKELGETIQSLKRSKSCVFIMYHLI